MTLSEKRKRTIGLISVGFFLYIGLSLILYNILLTPQINKLTGNDVYDFGNGSVTTLVNISRSAPSLCNFTMYQGANLVSFKCISGEFPFEYLSENVTLNYSAIFEYNSGDKDDPWKSYNPSLPNWTRQNIAVSGEYVSGSKGYWIFINHKTDYLLNGYKNSKSSISLNKGWNLIGFPREYNSSTNDAFFNIKNNITIVLQYKYDDLTGIGQWYTYKPGIIDEINYIEPEYGYWINVTESTTWVYP